jgi:hypothetical protein
VNEDDDEPRFLAMIGLVAVVVAVVILVFFGIGYLLGRVFL